MAINLAQIKNQLQPGLMKVEGQYNDVPPEWKDIFKTKQKQNADRACSAHPAAWHRAVQA